MPAFRAEITISLTTTISLDLEAVSIAAARAEINRQLSRQHSQAASELSEAASQIIRKGGEDDLDVEIHLQGG